MKIDIDKSADTVQPTDVVLPRIGLSRWRDIAPLVGVSREKFRRLGLEGKAPRTIQFTSKCAVYSNAEVLRWLEDPLGYRADDVALNTLNAA